MRTLVSPIRGGLSTRRAKRRNGARSNGFRIWPRLEVLESRCLLAGGATATFISKDTTTKGNWLGTYGSLGYDVVGAGSAGIKLPSDVTVTPSGESSYTWANPAPTTATQALEVPPSGSTRIAATWYSATSFTVDVDVTDSQSYNLELYVLDYDENNARAEQIQFTNANTKAVLSTQTVSGFSGGTYMNYTISGNVLITFTKTGGNNAVLSGLFFTGASSSATATFDGTDTSTKGNWLGTYGSLGDDVIGAGAPGVKLPSDVTLTPSGESSFTWANPAPTTATQALEVPPSGSTRIAATWYSATSFTVDVDVTDSQSYNLELYVLDYDNSKRAEQIQFTNANTNAVLSTQTVSGFTGGAYMNYTISGNVLITFTKTGGNNAGLSGLFFDADPPATALGVDTTMSKGAGIGAASQVETSQIGSLAGSSTLAAASPATLLAAHAAAPLAVGIESASIPVADEAGTVDLSGPDIASLLAADDQVTTRDSLVRDLALEHVSVVRRKLWATVG